MIAAGWGCERKEDLQPGEACETPGGSPLKVTAADRARIQRVCPNMDLETGLCLASETSITVTTCSGDSGGPHVVHGDDDLYYLVGLVSYGPVNCRPGGYDVAAFVPRILFDSTHLRDRRRLPRVHRERLPASLAGLLRMAGPPPRADVADAPWWRWVSSCSRESCRWWRRTRRSDGRRTACPVRWSSRRTPRRAVAGSRWRPRPVGGPCARTRSPSSSASLVSDGGSLAIRSSSDRGTCGALPETTNMVAAGPPTEVVTRRRCQGNSRGRPARRTPEGSCSWCACLKRPSS